MRFIWMDIFVSQPYSGKLRSAERSPMYCLLLTVLTRNPIISPVSAGGRNARFADSLDIGDHLQIKGRIQSREYSKRISETETESRTAYEVSASSLKLLEE